MKKTLLTRLLCMLLITALPFVALAETTASAQQAAMQDQQKIVTITLTPGEEMKQIPAIVDLCDSLAIQLRSLGKKTAGMSILLDEQAVFSANVRVDEAGIFIDSKEVYEKPLYFSQADLQNFMTEMMKSSGVDDATIAQFGQSISTSMLAGMSAAESASDAQINKSDLEDPEVRQAIINATGGDDSYLKFLEDLTSRMVVTEGEFTDADHDPATQKAELLVTQADIITVMDTTFMKNQIRSQLATENSSLTDAELDKKVADTIEEAKKELAEMDILMPVTVLSTEDKVVSMSMPITVKNKDIEDPVDASMSIDYRRLTNEAATVNHHFQMSVEEVDSQVMLMDGVVNHYQNGNIDLDFSIKEGSKSVLSAKGIYEITKDQTNALFSLLPDDSEEILFQYAKNKTEVGADHHLSFYLKDNGGEQMVLTADDKPLFTLNVSTALVADDGSFDAIIAATPDSATEMFKLTGEERNTFEATVLATITQAAMNAVAKLPNSVAVLLMGSPDSTAVPAAE